jgi:hypothetical protein
MLKTKPLFLLIFSALFLFVNEAKTLAAACCGGGFAVPSLIVGDDKAQVTASYSYSHVVDDVGSDSLWRRRESNETNETYKVAAARIFWDEWQAGLAIPVIRRARANTSSAGLGDVAATLGYEYLPDWDYNPWRPKGLGFLQLTLPTGRYINESSAAYQLDSRGRGFWALGMGTILTKTLGPWDIFSNIEAHKSFAKNYSNSQSRGILYPGYGGNFGVGGGYNLASLRLGTSLTWTYEDPVKVIGTIDSTGSPQRYATASLSGSYLLQNEWATTLTYADQTLFGKPINTSLGRSIAFLLQKRWLR